MSLCWSCEKLRVIPDQVLVHAAHSRDLNPILRCYADARKHLLYHIFYHPAHSKYIRPISTGHWRGQYRTEMPGTGSLRQHCCVFVRVPTRGPTVPQKRGARRACLPWNWQAAAMGLFLAVSGQSLPRDRKRSLVHAADGPGGMAAHRLWTRAHFA